MIVKKGQFNTAKIMIDEIDQTTDEQIQSFLNTPIFKNSNIVIMPDCHAGIGAVVGLTMTLNDYIIPNIVGVDIGCGVSTVVFDKKYISLEALDRFIQDNIPSGFHLNNSINPLVEDGFVDGFKAQINLLCPELDIDDFDKHLRALGTLGGGNHFIELGQADDKLYLTVHSGSRNLGLRVANYFQSKAKEQLEYYFVEKDKFKTLEFLHVSDNNYARYLQAVAFMTNYAQLNRMLILNKVVSFLRVDNYDVINSTHNYIGKDNIIRKGAISAQKDELCIIPFNMRDGIAICRGLGNKDYNFSAPHGAGRILSRKQAKKEIDVDILKNTMSAHNIYTSSINEETVDEAPDAYKETETILRCIKPTVEVIALVKPIYNFKASN